MKINETTLYKLIEDHGSTTVWNSTDKNPKEIDGFIVISHDLESSDQEDGGGHYAMVIQDVKTKKMYVSNYSDWDVDNTEFDEENEKVVGDADGGRCDLNCELVEVFPKTKMITVYETTP